jgi:hypothetical protein
MAAIARSYRATREKRVSGPKRRSWSFVQGRASLIKVPPSQINLSPIDRLKKPDSASTGIQPVAHLHGRPPFPKQLLF